MKFMKEALKLAQQAMDQGEQPIAYVLVLDGKIIVSGEDSSCFIRRLHHIKYAT